MKSSKNSLVMACKKAITVSRSPPIRPAFNSCRFGFALKKFWILRSGWLASIHSFRSVVGSEPRYRTPPHLRERVPKHLNVGAVDAPHKPDVRVVAEPLEDGQMPLKVRVDTRLDFHERGVRQAG